MTINKPFKKIIDAITGEETIIELTTEEITELQEIDTHLAEQKAAEDAAAEALATLKASAKAKLIAGTSLTAAEADTLIL